MAHAPSHGSRRLGMSRRFHQDTDDFGFGQAEGIVVQKRLERDLREMPVPTFAHPALERLSIGFLAQYAAHRTHHT